MSKLMVSGSQGPEHLGITDSSMQAGFLKVVWPPPASSSVTIVKNAYPGAPTEINSVQLWNWGPGVFISNLVNSLALTV